ncbi:hypothetical protein [Streptomyces sp. BE133]|uniref:hypothetical protein n=1 Tax=Streptomyces sp. BE133 TaxID=3002523 RepID=UPI002E77D9B7|nr:hypothetical protein [Streptomyces sp. BE133]MEE1807618.1 hypothetical protein [Streptomyces sp. BE133]
MLSPICGSFELEQAAHHLFEGITAAAEHAAAEMVRSEPRRHERASYRCPHNQGPGHWHIGCPLGRPPRDAAAAPAVISA